MDDAAGCNRFADDGACGSLRRATNCQRLVKRLVSESENHTITLESVNYYSGIVES